MISKSSLPKDEPIFTKRLQKLQNKAEGDIFVIEHPVDLFYLTGLELSSGSLLVKEKEARLFVDGRYIEIARAKSPVPASLLSEEEILSFLREGKEKSLKFDAETTSYQRFTKLQALVQKGRETAGLPISLLPVKGLIRDVRLIKDDIEKAALRESAQLNWSGYEHILSLLKEGISEIELAFEFEIFCRKKGAKKCSFDPIIAFGQNSSRPHHRSSEARLKKGDVVLIDVGVVLSHYCSDMTRVHFFGKADAEIDKLLKIVKESQRAALSLCKPGIRLEELDIAARRVMKKENCEEHFLHSLGHGLGLEIHEFPRIKEGGEDKDVVLQPGMAITIEPGLYLSGKGGVRYEDTIIITEDGYENLYPQEK